MITTIRPRIRIAVVGSAAAAALLLSGAPAALAAAPLPPTPPTATTSPTGGTGTTGGGTAGTGTTGTGTTGTGAGTGTGTTGTGSTTTARPTPPVVDPSCTTLATAEAAVLEAQNADDAAIQKASDAQSMLATDTAHGASPTVLAADNAAVGTAQHNRLLADNNLESAKNTVLADQQQIQARGVTCPRPGGDGPTGPPPQGSRDTGSTTNITVYNHARTTVNNVWDVFIDGGWYPVHYAPSQDPGQDQVAPSVEMPQVPTGPADTGDGSSAGR